MRNVRIYILMGLMSGAHLASADEVAVPALMRTVEQWVEVQDTLHRERVAWTEQQESMKQGMRLLEREKALLEERIAEWEETADEQSADQVAMESRRNQQQQAIQRVASALDERQRDVERMRDAFPDAFDAVGAEKSTVTRLRALLGAATAIHRDQQSIRYARELMAIPEAGRRQLEILYLGHAQAYAVSADDQYAAHGVWEHGAWRWTWAPDFAPGIREAIRVQQGELAPRWLYLPLGLMEGGAQ